MTPSPLTTCVRTSFPRFAGEIHTTSRCACVAARKVVRGKSGKGGFTLIELLIYTGILMLLVAVVGSTLLSMGRAYRSLGAEQAVENAGRVGLERMAREARSSHAIDLSGSTFGTSPGQLSLNTTDENGTAIVVQFFLSGESLHVREGGVDQGPLTVASARVTNLVFRKITTEKSTAIKIEMAVESGTSSAYHARSFYDTSILRPSYTQ